MPMISLSQDTKLNYEIHQPSAASAIVLIHGLGATHESWGFQIQPLQDAGYCIICPDMRGFGQSKTKKAPSFSVMAKDIVTLLDSHDFQRATIVGISMGGAVAMQAAVDYPDKVNALVLVNTFARFKPNSPMLWLYFALRLVYVHLIGLPTQAKLVAHHVFPQPSQLPFRQKLIEQIIQSDPIIYRKMMRLLARFDIFDSLNTLKIPTLIISGEKDTTVPLAVQNEIANQIPNCKQIVIPSGGHAVSVEFPHMFNNHLLEFLSALKLGIRT